MPEPAAGGRSAVGNSREAELDRCAIAEDTHGCRDRPASGVNRLLASNSGADKLILDVRDVDSVRDSGLAALRLLRHRAHQAGKRLTVVARDSAA